MLSSFTKTEILSNLVVDLFPAIKINYELKISIFKNHAKAPFKYQ